MPNVVRFTLPTARTLNVRGAGQFNAGVLDVDADNLSLVKRTRYLVKPFGAIEVGIVAAGTAYPSLPAVPATPPPDPYPQYVTDADLSNLASGPSAALKAAFDTRLAVVASATVDAALAVDTLTPVDASAAARTMTLPTGQTAGKRILVEKIDTSANTVTVSGSIRGSAGTIVLVGQYETIELVTDSAGSWHPSAGHKTKAWLDSRYLQVRARPALYFPEDFGAKGDGTTDDTAAITAAIDAVTTHGVGTLQLQDKTYLVNGTPDITRAGNSIIPLPRITAQNPIPVKILGAGRMQGATLSGSIIKTTRTGDNYDATHGCPSVIGGPTDNTFSYLHLTLEDLMVQVPNNPGVAGIDLMGIADVEINGVTAQTATANNSTVQPTNNLAAFGLRMPRNSNWGRSLIHTYAGFGFYYGLVANTEHLTITNLITKYCYVGFALVAGGGPHGFSIQNWQSEWLAYHLAGYGTAGFTNIVGGGNAASGAIHLWDIEDSATGQWYSTVQHLQDASSVLRMRANIIHMKTGGVYVTSGLGITGGKNAALYDVGGSMARGNFTPQIPASGSAAVVKDSTGNLLYRDVALTITGGTVTAITVDGVATGLTSGTVIVPTGRPYSITYSVAPTVVATAL